MKPVWLLVVAMTLTGCALLGKMVTQVGGKASDLERWAAEGEKAAQPWRTTIAKEAEKTGYSAPCCSGAFVLVSAGESDAKKSVWLLISNEQSLPTATLGIGESVIWRRNINSGRIADWPNVRSVYAYSNIGPYIEWKVASPVTSDTIRLQLADEDSKKFISYNGERASRLGELFYSSSGEEWSTQKRPSSNGSLNYGTTARGIRFDDGAIVIAERTPDLSDGYMEDYYFIICIPGGEGWKCTVLRDHAVDLKGVLVAKKLHVYSTNR